MKGTALIGIEVAAFLLIIAETYAFFEAIVPLGPAPRGLGEYTGIAILKLGMTVGLGVLWLVVITSLTRIYVRSRLKNLTPTPSS